MRQMHLVGFLQAQNCTNFAVLLAASGQPVGLHEPGLLPGDRPHPGAREVRPRLLRRPAVHAGPLRRRPRAHHRARHPLREDGPDRGADDDGRGDDAARPRRHGQHHLFRALPRRPRLPDPGPDVGRPRRLERRDLAERRRGREHGPRRDHGARHPLRPRRRVHRGGARPLGFLGGRRADRRQGERALRRRAEGASPGVQGAVPADPRALHRAAQPAGPARADPGRRQRPRQALLGAMGRAGLRRLDADRGGEARLPRVQGPHRLLRARPGQREGDDKLLPRSSRRRRRRRRTRRR